MRLKKFASILLIGLGLAIATGFATVFLATFTSIFGVGSAAIDTCKYHAEVYDGLELTRLTQELQGSGLIGRIHGTVPTANMAVLSVRDPNNFFSHEEFSLLSRNSDVQATLNPLHRHDRVCVQGRILDNSSPQKHVLVENLKVMDAWAETDDSPAYEYEAGVPAELLGGTRFVGKVHAIGADGHMLITEYKDQIIPIFVRDATISDSLYRGDIVRITYTIQRRPQEPIHLQLDGTVEQPVEVLDAIASWHEQPKTLSGELVKFPQSPQIQFDVYAINVDTDGIQRTFTLVNFEDTAAFQSIRDRLAEIWDDHADSVVNGRNYLINPGVTIQAQGVINVVSPEQANPQILLESIEALDVMTADVAASDVAASGVMEM
ncbi:MAG: hypothetical protein F6K30_17590 [Cyanothece sp. SIO2G6]|nr:hypothetical protein [Cyanothece sp. SIO2G6]